MDDEVEAQGAEDGELGEDGALDEEDGDGDEEYLNPESIGASTTHFPSV